VRVVTAIVFVALLTAVAACGDRAEVPNASPPAPSVLPPSPPLPPAPAPPSAPGLSSAVLVISNFRATETPASPNGYAYSVKFLLVETTGKTGAIITNIRTSDGRDSDNTGYLCWRDPIRVEPGGTLDTFDAGWEALVYCAPAFWSSAPVLSMSVLVSYVDDDGRAGSVAATVNVTR
jgi:hypothetical protein